MIKGVNKWKTLAKRISCEGRCEFDGRICNPGQKRTIIGVSVIHSKAHKTSRVKKDYIWNSITCSCECDKDYDIDE